MVILVALAMTGVVAKNKKSPSGRDSLSLPGCQRRFFLFVLKTVTVHK